MRTKNSGVQGRRARSARYAEAHGKGHVEDADGDGDLDMVLHYETKQTGIDPGDTQACLTGETFGGTAIEGCDSVKTL